MEELREYNPKEIEEKWSKFWIEKAIYHVEKPDKRKKFSVVIPPPNVTGSLHMGHALNSTLQDIVCRWQRMKGRQVVWVPGFDHAGIATQYVVEKQLAQEGKSRLELGREEFIRRVWEWVPKSRNAIRTQLEKLGVSVDWKRERFTLDEGFSRAVRKAFRELYEKGLIYRSEYIVNWCPKDLTALSDLEVEHEEEKGKLWYIKYPLEDGSGYITVATTRPETMLGDTAVAVHPEDERYKHLIGKRLRLPLVNWKRRTLSGEEIDEFIPVVADERVKPEFGTGAVKVTPAHDPNDFEIGKTHNLPFVRVMDEQAKMNENAGEFAGLDRYEARKRIVEKLREQGLLEKEEEHLHAVGRCYRCKTVIEPMVSEQWFVKVSDPAIKDTSIKVVEEGEEEVEEREVFIQYAEVEGLTITIPVSDETSGETKAVIVLDKGIEFLTGIREGELAYVYYPEGKPEVAQRAKELTYEFMQKSSGLEFLIGLEGEITVIRQGIESKIEAGRYLLAFEGNRLNLYRWEETPQFLQVIESGHARLEPVQKSIKVKVEREKRREVRKKQVKFIPEQWKKFYLDWMYNLRDWCISRQIWWGHRIPVWDCQDCGHANVFTDDDFDRVYDKLIFNLIADGKLKNEFTPEEVEEILKSPNFVHPEMSVLDFYKKFAFHKYHSTDVDAHSLRLFFTQEANPMAMLTPGVSTRGLYRYDSKSKKWRMVLRCKKCGSENLKQEEDVLDTWFSSALWPFGVFGWPEESEDLKNLYPTNLLVTGFDIIFFWVARMIMMGTYFMKDIPFEDVYVHALVRDKKGQKMSKTKGNVIDPLEIIDKYGADALRFTLAILTVQGRDIKLSEKRFEGYKHFANKIWNATRFVLMNTPEDFATMLPYMAPLRPEDKWIMTLLNETAEKVDKALQNYDVSRGAQAIYDFFWSDFCDWFIEFSKERIYKPIPEGDDEETQKEKAKILSEKTTALYTLHYVLEKALRILHPFMPYITEELWHRLPASKGESISLKDFPQKKQEELFPEETRRVERLREIISTIRSLRSDLQIEPSKRLKAFYRTEGEFSKSVIEEFKNHILNLAKLESFEEAPERPENTVATFSKDVEVFLSVEGHVDIEKLSQSYEKKKEKLLAELERVNKKLSNENFLKKAPPEVVEKERRIKEELEEDLQKVERILKVLEK
ncbi:MAG: valine--tRNA ligase [Aquificae bacterium]|nr:valine--tRNA ligase [Aquificota bacterium]